MKENSWKASETSNIHVTGRMRPKYCIACILWYFILDHAALNLVFALETFLSAHNFMYQINVRFLLIFRRQKALMKYAMVKAWKMRFLSLFSPVLRLFGAACALWTIELGVLLAASEPEPVVWLCAVCSSSPIYKNCSLVYGTLATVEKIIFSSSIRFPRRSSITCWHSMCTMVIMLL